MPTTGERFERAVEIMARLRAPGGCPWDREQTFDSIKPFTLEETYEVLEAIDNRDWDELVGELGDLLLQVLFYAEMAQEEKHFKIDDVLDRLSNKLVNRHPHVFGDVEAKTSADVLRNWEAIKAEEKKKRLEVWGPQDQGSGSQRGDALATTGETPALEESVLSGVSSKMPALVEAIKLSSRAAHVGFEWPQISQLFDKLHEETCELQSELDKLPEPNLKPPERGVASSGRQQIAPELRERLEDEVGDLFFVMVNIARYLSLDPESALRKTNRKFRNRFQWVERKLHEQGRKPPEATLDEMEGLWQESKRQGHK
jgi:MazG family protein